MAREVRGYRVADTGQSPEGPVRCWSIRSLYEGNLLSPGHWVAWVLDHLRLSSLQVLRAYVVASIMAKVVLCPMSSSLASEGIENSFE
jgi:hypothetical protein